MEMEQPQSSEIKFQTVDLYGGTFKASLPSGLVDMSNVRQVPNHQEFYANADTGANVIFEINEMVKNVDDNEAVEFFFNNLAKDNDAKESKIARQGKLDLPGCKGYHTSYAIGEHLVNERLDNKGPELRLRVHMALIRLKKVTSDFLIIMAVPVKSGFSEKDGQQCEFAFETILKSFEIKSLEVFKK
ncbi:hypothetical protein AAMO2058_001324100 [Amorphochlora amoebiformis]